MSNKNKNTTGDSDRDKSPKGAERNLIKDWRDDTADLAEPNRDEPPSSRHPERR